MHWIPPSPIVCAELHQVFNVSPAPNIAGCIDILWKGYKQWKLTRTRKIYINDYQEIWAHSWHSLMTKADEVRFSLEFVSSSHFLWLTLISFIKLKIHIQKLHIKNWINTMSTILFENIIWHATINFVPSKNFLPWSCSIKFCNT